MLWVDMSWICGKTILDKQLSMIASEIYVHRVRNKQYTKIQASNLKKNLLHWEEGHS